MGICGHSRKIVPNNAGFCFLWILYLWSTLIRFVRDSEIYF